MTEEVTETINDAIRSGNRSADCLVKTRRLRNRMRRYFEKECVRLDLIKDGGVGFRGVPSSEVGRVKMTPVERREFAKKHSFRNSVKKRPRATTGVFRGQLAKKEDGLYLNRIDYDLVENRFKGGLPRPYRPALLARYAGYFFENSNTRAETDGLADIRFNEYHIPSIKEEVQRVISHELQHVKNRTDIVIYLEEGKGNPPEDLYLFLFHPKTRPLLSRIKQYYEKHRGEGYPFKKNVTLPTWGNKSDTGNYVGYDELLSLLRGYEVYRSQYAAMRERGIEKTVIKRMLAPQPYEFIDAFLPTDLELLDPQCRQKLSQKVLASRPDIKRLLDKEKGPQNDVTITIDNP